MRHRSLDAAASHYAREFDVSTLITQVLLNRGFNGLESMKAVLSPDLSQLSDPFRMRNMDRAVRRLRRAIVRKERIRIHGDYDVDGITSTAVLILGLRALGADVDYHIINRRDASVGLSVASLERDHLPFEPSVIVTADCGTSSNAAIEVAREHGVDVIVVDHHLPGTFLPKCEALLNPQQPRCDFPFKPLAAVGVAFNLIAALNAFLRDDGDWPNVDLASLMDLVALGTVSDLVPLIGDNRVFVHFGLQLIRAARRPGICALMRAADLISRSSDEGIADSINVRTIGFRLAPLLNAAGRMDDANKCVELLTTDSFRVADGIANELMKANAERQSRERAVLEEAVAQATRLTKSGHVVLVLASEEWHPGVLGIVASRLVERFNRPALVASVDESGMAKGSVRAPEGVDMLEALRACRDILDTYGGHRAAAGVAFPYQDFDALVERLNVEVSRQLPDGSVPERTLLVDALVDLGDLDTSALGALDQLAPFGAGYAEPLLEARGVVPVQARTVGAKNVRLRIRKGAKTYSAFAFNMASRVDELRAPVDILFHPRVLRTAKGVEVELLIRDFAQRT